MASLACLWLREMLPWLRRMKMNRARSAFDKAETVGIETTSAGANAHTHAHTHTHTRTHARRQRRATLSDRPTNQPTNRPMDQWEARAPGADKKKNPGKYARKGCEKSVICRPWNRDITANTEALERLYQNQLGREVWPGPTYPSFLPLDN